ncbi:MAG: DUF2341 domain-containing protein, partial [Chitinivibrionales bacterium]|nr:DUF2341 domain-containing protein [Chitinivibrionales bacterium]MBD3395551.1 DUF2341 domain-containing protein [Chitinivibrionales bacterium]
MRISRVVPCAFVALFALLAVSAARAENLNEWSNQRIIYLNTTSGGANVGGDVDNFPVLLRLSGGDYPTGVQTGGDDLRFTDAAGAQLAYEVERCDGSNAEIWVLVPKVKGNDRTMIRMFWGKTDANPKSNGSDVFQTSNGFVAVYHMNNNPENQTADIVDATSNGYDATPYHMELADLVDGQIGKGINLDDDATDEYIQTPMNPLKTADNFTVSAWASSDKWESANEGILLWEGDIAGNGGGPEHEVDWSVGWCRQYISNTFGFGWEGDGNNGENTNDFFIKNTSMSGSAMWYMVTKVTDVDGSSGTPS